MTASPLLRPVFLPVAAEPTPIPGTSPRRDGIVRVVHRPADAAKAEATDARPETASTACGCGTVEEITDAVAASIRPALDRITEALETLLGEVAEMRSRLDADLADG